MASSLPPSARPLSTHWAFVVQLREGTLLTPRDIQGRAEHITSGQATDFTSLVELLSFMAKVLTTPADGETYC